MLRSKQTSTATPPPNCQYSSYNDNGGKCPGALLYSGPSSVNGMMLCCDLPGCEWQGISPVSNPTNCTQGFNCGNSPMSRVRLCCQSSQCPPGSFAGKPTACSDIALTLNLFDLPAH